MKSPRASHILSTSIATLLTVSLPVLADTVIVDGQFVANSITEFSPNQGMNSWEYGYYNLTLDGDAQYAAGDFQYLLSGGWTTYSISGPPPWTAIFDGLGGHPNGTNSAPNQEMWAIRRYTVQPGEEGSIDVNWFVRPASTGFTSAEVFLNGVSLDAGSGTVARKITVNASAGDVIDIALKPEGVDFSDSSHFGMTLQKPQTYETGPLLADSVAEFAGVQGQNGWLYGYYNLTLNGPPDPGGADFIEFTPDYWNGSFWNWPAPADPPWTEIGPVGGHPNGTNQAPPNGDEHWATRRYVVQPGEEGDVLIEWSLSKSNPNGDGTTVRIFVNGVEMDAAAVAGADTTGVHRGVVVPGIAAGDVIDIALSPQGLQNFSGQGGDPANDGSDGSNFSAKIWNIPEPGSAVLLAVGAGLLSVRRRRS